ncbi:MAG: SDR family oxidoreductase [Hyphomicrobiales bacterium]|nr:MAG: SDR family oxidoreductase [Hyphomicrobiales bacterium]
MSFEGLKVLVTGSTRGIGKATARAFRDRGATVAVNGRRAADVDGAIADLGGGDLVAAAGDLTSAAACQDVLQRAIHALGGLDILVNNAGVYAEGPVDDVSEETYDWMMDVNVRGVFFCSQAALPALRKSKGSIVNTASESGLVGNRNAALYCASKGAVVNMTRAMAFDFAPDVRVNAVCPGAVMTDMLTGGKELADDDPLLKQMYDYTPLHRVAQPEEIADAILYLANPASKFTTGAMLSVDGGSTATR